MTKSGHTFNSNATTATKEELLSVKTLASLYDFKSGTTGNSSQSNSSSTATAGQTKQQKDSSAVTARLEDSKLFQKGVTSFCTNSTKLKGHLVIFFFATGHFA